MKRADQKTDWLSVLSLYFDGLRGQILYELVLDLRKEVELLLHSNYRKVGKSIKTDFG